MLDCILRVIISQVCEILKGEERGTPNSFSEPGVCSMGRPWKWDGRGHSFLWGIKVDLE